MQTDHTEANKSFKEAVKLPLDKWMLMLNAMASELWHNLRLNWFFNIFINIRGKNAQAMMKRIRLI